MTKMGDTGFDTLPDVQTKTANLVLSAARALQLQPDLNRLVELWANLPEPVRRSILVLAEQFGES